MIKGIGNDITEVERLAAKITGTQGFRELVFSEAEIAYCEKQVHKYEHYAARFAAKEAFFKALGTGWLSGTAFNEVEIINNTDGKPAINLRGNTRSTVTSIGNFTILVSLSHISAIASAVVILEEHDA